MCFSAFTFDTFYLIFLHFLSFSSSEKLLHLEEKMWRDREKVVDLPWEISYWWWSAPRGKLMEKVFVWLFKSKFYYKFQPHRSNLKIFPARFGREKLCVTHCLHHSVESFLSQAQLRVSHRTLRRPFVARPDPFWPISLTKCQCQKALKKVHTWCTSIKSHSAYMFWVWRLLFSNCGSEIT